MRQCPLCRGKSHPIVDGLFDTRFGSPGLYSVTECGKCSVLSTLPKPSERVLGRLYMRYYNFGGSGRGGYERIREAFHRSFLYRFWLAVDGDIAFQAESPSSPVGQGALSSRWTLSLCRRAGRRGIRSTTGRIGAIRLLEVGCNEGRNLGLYRANGYEAEGQEINPRAAAAARRRGFRVHLGPLKSVKGQFDVVVLANVLEHSSEPMGMLRQVRRLLLPGGEVRISLPNNRSWLRYVFGRKWINWHVPFHLWHFDAKVLRQMLAKSGFTISKIRNVTPALWVAQSGISALFSRPGHPNRQLRNPFLLAFLMLISRFIFFPFIWIGNLLGRGDALIVETRKSG